MRTMTISYSRLQVSALSGGSEAGVAAISLLRHAVGLLNVVK